MKLLGFSDTSEVNGVLSIEYCDESSGRYIAIRLADGRVINVAPENDIILIAKEDEEFSSEIAIAFDMGGGMEESNYYEVRDFASGNTARFNRK